MAIGSASCPTCGKSFNVDSSMVGQSVLCPWCGEKVYMEGVDAPREMQVPVGILHDSAQKEQEQEEGAEVQSDSSHRPLPRKPIADNIWEPRHTPLKTEELVFRWLFALIVLLGVFLVCHSAFKRRSTQIANDAKPIPPVLIQPTSSNVDTDLAGKKADVNVDNVETEAGKKLREYLAAFRASHSYDSFSLLVSQLCEAKLADDALVRESMEAIVKWVDSQGDGDLPEETNVRHFNDSAKFRVLLAKMCDDEQWKRMGLDAYAPMLRERINRHADKLVDDMECLKTAIEFIDLTGQRPTVASVERLQQVLAPISRKGAYADAARLGGKYISMVQEAYRILAGDVSLEKLVSLPTSVIPECEKCKGSGEKICPDCNNTRICKLCGGTGMRFVEGFESTRRWHGKPQTDSGGQRQIPCDKVCPTCKSVSSRKCQVCNGSGRHVDAVALKNELCSQAKITKDAIEKVIKALTSATQTESPERP